MMSATYYSGQTPEIGDTVRLVPHADHCLFRVTGIKGRLLRLEWSERAYTTDAFTLVRRQETPMSEPIQEPLVIWPEEREPLTWPDLESGELFVFDADPRESQCICLCRLVGWSPWMHASGVAMIPSATVLTRERDPVRRVKMTRAPQFTVE